jgi:hypothetical protein
VAGIVLIGSAEHLEALKQRDDLRGALAFPDAEALRALDAITRQHPSVVALERAFAGTTRGAALINRINADPSLSACEIRIISHNATAQAPPAPPPDPVEEIPAPATPEPEPSAPAAAPLDQRGTRRAPRFKIADGVEVLIDGNPASLVDLSIVGAQVVSPTILRPNQRIRIAFPDSGRPIRISAAVAWASFEIPKGTTRYRAGVEFFDADASTLTKFIDANKRHT